MTHKNKADTPNQASTVSHVFSNGSIAEMIFRRDGRQTAYVVWDGQEAIERSSFELNGGGYAMPLAASNSLLTHRVVLFPSGVAAYESTKSLIADVRAFIRRYVDLEEAFEDVATHYVLFTWIYDAFNEVPYLRVRGDYGSGKSRFLLTVGSICYKPVFASGTSTLSPLFRILDMVRGTLVMDESDFRLSDEKVDVIKLLNNGNAAGFPVLRSELTPQKEFSPRAFDVFGPKIIATRGLFTDRALESRCITEELSSNPPRPDIPLNLPPEFHQQAEALRNRLLLYRFQNLSDARDVETVTDRTMEPRISQVFGPLLATIDDLQVREHIQGMARRYADDLAVERSMGIEAQVLEVIWDLRKKWPYPTVGQIATGFNGKFAAESRHLATPRWVGSFLRNKLSLTPRKRHGNFSLCVEHNVKLAILFRRYSIGTDVAAKH